MSITGKAFSELSAQQKADMRDQMRGYQVYQANFYQSSTDHPTITILENTLPWTPNWVRDGAGYYRGCYSTLIYGSYEESLRYRLVVPSKGFYIQHPYKYEYNIVFYWDSKSETFTFDVTTYRGDYTGGSMNSLDDLLQMLTNNGVLYLELRRYL